ncbi:MAG: enoyl-CoA hydratase/isomerase family protein [Oscillospiraceae bacterium]|jgi:enoyl-CoA hydratase|nr:enoyl-CoA hydratase/isomerase family protein [Oscillospiraceae bacterium]
MPLIQIEINEHVAVLTLHRPEALNALNSALLDELLEATARIAADKNIRAVVLTGAGRAFAAGADISEMRDFTPEAAKAYAEKGNRAFLALENLPQPVIAAVNGYALGGGCELALACDLRLASDKARFGQPEVGLGVPPGFGGTQRLPRAVGMGHAMRMILAGLAIDAAEALRIGLVCAVYPADALLDEAMKLAQAMAKQAPLAVRAAKKAMREGATLPIEEGLKLETALFADCFASADQKEGMGAFLEKRKDIQFRGC